MSTAHPSTERSLLITGARRRTPGTPSSSELIATLRRQTGSSEALVSLFDARSIAGERHLVSAWAHLGRSRRSGAQRLRDRGAEFALYVSGDDQLGRALAKVGVGPSTEEFVLVVERPRSLEETLRALELVADPTALPREPSEETMVRLGITAVERATVPRSSWEGLVLERVALVDLSPAGATAPSAATKLR